MSAEVTQDRGWVYLRGSGHLMLSPTEARNLATALLMQANEADDARKAKQLANQS